MSYSLTLTYKEALQYNLIKCEYCGFSKSHHPNTGKKLFKYSKKCKGWKPKAVTGELYKVAKKI